MLLQLVRSWRAHAASGWLMLSGTLAALIYAGVVRAMPLAAAYTKPLRNINKIAPALWPTVLLTVGAVVVLFGAYAVGARYVGAAARSRLLRLLVLGLPLLFAGLLLFAYPLTSTDIYDYLFRGRMLAHYQANTFLAKPKEFLADPLLPFVAWKHVVTAYGPLWEGISLLTARLAGERPGPPLEPALPQLLRLLFAYKLLAWLGFLLCALVIWAASEGEAAERRWQAVYLWLWNPLALWETIGAAHNDVWMLLPVVLALGIMRYWMAHQPRVERAFPWMPRQPLEGTLCAGSLRGALLLPTAALLLITVGGLIKFAVLMFGPVVLAAALRRQVGWRRRLALLALAGGACLALLAAAYAPFWSGWATFQNVGDRGTMLNVSWLTGIRSVLLFTMPEQQAEYIASTSGLALLMLGVIAAAWAAWRRPEALIRQVLGLLLWFLLVCNPWFMPWYALWALPIAALLPWPSRAWWAVGLFALLAFAYYVGDGLVMEQFTFAQKSFAREGFLAAAIYGPALLILTWPRREMSPRAATWCLALCGLGMIAICAGFAVRYPLSANSAGLTDIGKLSKYSADDFAGFVLGMATLFGLYLSGLQACRRLPPRRALGIVFVSGALLALVMLGLYPTNAIDVFLYATRSRLLTYYGVDPNAVPLDRFPTDLWASYSIKEWASHVSPYGPLWNLVAAPITALAGDRILVALVGFKLLMLACLLISGWLVARILARARATPEEAPQDWPAPAAGALLLLWNPLVLWEGIGNAHNDLLLLVPLLLALWAFTARRAALVLPLLLLAGLIKYVTLPLIPLAIVALWRRAADRGQRRRLALRSLGLCVIVLLIGFAPFYNPVAIAHSVLAQGQIVATSPASALAALLASHFSSALIIGWARLVGSGALLLIMALLAWRLWRRPQDLPRACFEALFALLMLATLNLRPWYLIWLVALAAVSPAPWPARRAVTWSVGGLCLYAFLIWVEAWWKPGPALIKLVAVLLFVAPAALLTLAELLIALRQRPIVARL
ncbi:MAG: hypothetical protein HGA65_08555 [Oscillochloris sp.]|nr:hypothetical protein [Oscillochloris sp.]